MIAKFRKGSYRLAAAAIILVLVLSGVILTITLKSGKNTESAVDPNVSSMKGTFSSWKVERLNDWAKWFPSLARANDFSGFRFKVPDYLPPGYQLQNVEVLKKYVNRIDNQVTITFVSNFGKSDEKKFTLLVSKGNLLQTYSRSVAGDVRSNAPASWGNAQVRAYKQDEVTYAGIKGTLVTQIQNYEYHQPEREKSFVWQDEGVWYAMNYYSENHSREGHPEFWTNISQGELEKFLLSFTFPQQIQNVSYDGKGNSFPLYDEKDLLEAKKILGFKVKFPIGLSNNQLKLIDSILLQAGDQNTGYDFRPGADSIENIYHAEYNSKIYEINDELALYQSKVPIVNAAKLSVIRKLNINGIDISVGEDNNNVYNEYGRGTTNKKDTRSQTYYLWKQNDIYYTAIFLGLDKNQEEIVKTLVLAPIQ
ncbi:peptidase M56 [Paenibacillus sp. BJ-4]|uniref:peptidase M56 n=1 Tax=Paenibacillus sp. BJ-4 TaxID=2878097 RepID=UPI001CEFB689|nr:peptidase M56 [Paenibacillus sp. BJ-4]